MVNIAKKYGEIWWYAEEFDIIEHNATKWDSQNRDVTNG